MLALNLEAPLKLKFHVPPWLVMKDVRCNVRGHGGPPSGVWGDHPLLGYAGWLTLLADLAGFMNHRTILILLCPQQRMNAMWLPPLTQERKKWRARIMGGYPCPHVDTETDRWCYPCWLGTGEVQFPGRVDGTGRNIHNLKQRTVKETKGHSYNHTCSSPYAHQFHLPADRLLLLARLDLAFGKLWT